MNHFWTMLKQRTLGFAAGKELALAISVDESLWTQHVPLDDDFQSLPKRNRATW